MAVQAADRRQAGCACPHFRLTRRSFLLLVGALAALELRGLGPLDVQFARDSTAASATLTPSARGGYIEAAGVSEAVRAVDVGAPPMPIARVTKEHEPRVYWDPPDEPSAAPGASAAVGATVAALEVGGANVAAGGAGERDEPAEAWESRRKRTHRSIEARCVEARVRR
jgi:hypothetical protein